MSARRVLKSVVRQIVPSRLLVWNGLPATRQIALTFDDGPNPEHTPRVLEILRNAAARATFFVVGRNVEQHPALTAELIAAGHELGNHTYSHVDLRRVSLRQGQEELARTDALLREIDPRFCGLFRPPWGRLGLSGTLYTLRSRNRAVMWSRDSLDYHRNSTDRIVRRILSDPLPGGEILLFHDDNPYTSEALPSLLSELGQRGFSFCTVSDLLSSVSGHREGP